MRDGGPGVEHDGGQSCRRNCGIDRAQEIRRDKSGQYATGNAEGINDEEEVDGIETGKRSVCVAVQIDLRNRVRKGKSLRKQHAP